LLTENCRLERTSERPSEELLKNRLALATTKRLFEEKIEGLGLKLSTRNINSDLVQGACEALKSLIKPANF
jgi:hypothetical protein